MKTFYLLISAMLSTVMLNAQNPLIIKTVSSTATLPKDFSQDNWENNRWNGKYFYQGTGTPTKLIVTDGTDAGTQLVSDIGSGNIVNTIPAQDFIYIITNATTGTAPSFLVNTEIWKSDGTAAGTTLVKAMEPHGFTAQGNYFTSDNQNKRNYSVNGNIMIFGGRDASSGRELWRTDGTTAGTYMVKDIKPGTGDSYTSNFAKLNDGYVYFSAAAVGFGTTLWRTDGTAAGTTEIAVPNLTVNGTCIGIVNNKLIFYGNDNNVTGMEPWVSDGTVAGTFRLADINTGTQNSLPGTTQNLQLRFNNKYCFFLSKTATAQTLWRTDGTIAGTIQLTPDPLIPISENNNSGGGYCSISNAGLYWIGANSKVYFSDGTVSGTRLVKDNLNTAVHIYQYKNAAWFAARAANSSDDEPWRTDGTTANTARALDISPGGIGATLYSGDPFGYFELNGYLYFFATNNNLGTRHLFRYNGDFTYNGSQTGGRWKDSTNWNSMMPPGITDTVYINTGTANALNINGANAYAGLLQMQSGATINFTNATDSLFVNSTLATSSNNTFTGNGVLVLKNASNEQVQLNNGFSANNVSVQSSTNLQNGTVTINGLLNLTSNAKLSLNSNNLVLTGNTSSATGNATSYIVTNGTGKLTVQNIGTGARTGAVSFPIGTANNYNPVQFSNTGTADNFSIRVQPKVNGAYTGEASSGNPYFTNAVDATWFITEGTAGGSNASINLQWDASQELLGFNRNQSRFGHYTGGSWLLGTAGTASGSSPYSFTVTGITSFSPFGIFNSNAALPIYSAKLLVTKTGSSNQLSWNIVATNASNIAIEKSADGIQFTELKVMPFVAFSLFNDAQVSPIGKTYYRLKVLDKNGQYTYSNIVSIANENVGNISVYPTAVQSQFTVQNNNNSKLIIQLYNASGKLMVTQALNLGTNFISIVPFAIGCYHYKIYNNAILLNTGTIIKQ